VINQGFNIFGVTDIFCVAFVEIEVEVEIEEEEEAKVEK
jgi:hypothetical protein